MTRWLAVSAALVALGGTPSQEAACHRACAQCRVECRHDAACKQTCLQLKRACCRQCGSGPGPRTTCSCT